VTDPDTERQIRAVIDGITDALHSADVQKLDSLMSDRPGSTHIGTDPDEWWSKQQLLAGIEGAMSVAGNPIRAEIGEVSIHVLGDVAWTEGTARFINAGGAQRAVRTTGVFVREDGAWRAVQSHASIGIPNEQIFTS
jgi:ketosteroid isomerase-like protein